MRSFEGPSRMSPSQMLDRASRRRYDAARRIALAINNMAAMMLGPNSARSLDEVTLTTTGPSSWPIANAAVIAAIKRGAASPAMRRASCMPAIVRTMNVPPMATAANTSVAGVGRNRRRNDPGRHDDLACSPHSARRGLAQEQRRDNGRPRRGHAEHGPGPAEYRGVGQQVPCERRQIRRRNDVAETEGTVAADEQPGIGRKRFRSSR